MFKLDFIKNFGNSKKNAPTLAETMPILFYKDTNGHIEHGSLYVTHASFGLKNVPISLAYRDLKEAPEMTPAILAHIWDMAERQGYVVHGLRSYSTLFPVQPAPRIATGHNDRPARQGGVARTHRRPSGEPRHNQQAQAA